MATSSKSTLHDLLYCAILEIRAASETGSSTDDQEFVNLLAHLIHNWPGKLRDAALPSDYDALLREFWQTRDRRADPWMRDRLTFLGVNPEALT